MTRIETIKALRTMLHHSLYWLEHGLPCSNKMYIRKSTSHVSINDEHGLTNMLALLYNDMGYCRIKMLCTAHEELYIVGGTNPDNTVRFKLLYHNHGNGITNLLEDKLFSIRTKRMADYLATTSFNLVVNMLREFNDAGVTYKLRGQVVMADAKCTQ